MAGRRYLSLTLLAATMLLCGCSTRSISDSGYPGSRGNPLYHGELSEFDVLGIDASTPVSDAEIGAQFTEYRKITVKRGAPILVIQSGALIPDDAMLRELGRQLVISPFSGIPIAGSAARPASYAHALRLAAAKGGYEVIVCYWGVLESAVENHATKLVSWVPIIGMAVPDESQHMRIRLRVAVVDVRSGRWSMFSPENFEDEALTAGAIRRQSDQEQVALLKDRAYRAAAQTFSARFVE
jgi:hypothetical protein